MKRTSTLLLLAAVILAGILAWALSERPTSGELAREERRILPGLRPAEITELTISTGNKKIVRLRAGPEGRGRWMITSPLRLRADQSVVEDMVRSLAEASQQSRPIRSEEVPEFDPADYGLAPPRGRISFGTAERRRTVLVGAESGLGDLVYVSTPEKKTVRTVRAEAVGFVEMTLTELRSKRLLPTVKFSRLTGVYLEGPGDDGQGPTEIVCRKIDGIWEMQEPVHDLAAPDALQTLARTLSNHELSGDDFLSDEPSRAAEYGLDAPDATVTFQLGQDRHVVELSRHHAGEGEQFYARNAAEPAIVRILPSLYTQLTAPLREGANSLRATSLADYDPERVHRLTIARGDGLQVIEKRDKGWCMVGDDPTPADRQAVENIVRGLREAKVEDFIADTPERPGVYGLEEDRRWRVRLMNGAGNLLADMEFGRHNENGNLTFARRPGYPPVLGIRNADWLSEIKTGRPALLDRMVLQLPAERAVSVDIRREGDRAACRRGEPGDSWRLTRPTSGAADARAVQAILEELSPLRAEAVVAETADEPANYGLDEPAMTVTVECVAREKEQPRGAGHREGRTVSRTLLIGDRRHASPKGYYATRGKAKPGSRVFVLSERTVKTLRAQLASKIISRTEGVRRMTFASGGRSVTFVFDGAQQLWRTRSGEDPTDALQDKLKAAAELVENFRGKRVEAYFVRDPAAYGFDSPALTVTFADQSTAGKRIVLGRELEAGDRYVRGPATGFVLTVSGRDAEKLLEIFREAGGRKR